MAASGEQVTLRIVAQEVATAAITRVREGVAGIGTTAAAASAEATVALQRMQAGFVGAAASAKTSLAGISTAAAGAATSIGAAGVAAGRSFGAGFASTVSGFLKPTLAIFAIGGIAGFVKDGVKAAGQEALQLRRVTQAFGESGEAIKKWAENSANDMGLTSEAALKLAADYGTYLHSFGLGQQQSAEMSLKLMTMTQDIAKYTGKSTVDVENAIVSALKGRALALKGLGIGITAQSIQQAALNHGLSDGTTKLSDAARAQAIYFAIIEQAQPMLGAYAKSASSMSTMNQNLTVKMEDLSKEVGTSLMPFLKQAVGLITDAVVPAFGMLLVPVRLLGAALGLLPKPIQTGIAAWLVLLALRGPLTKMFTAISNGLYLLAASMGSTGVVGAIQKMLLGLSSLATFMATGLMFAIVAVTIAIIGFIKAHNDAAESTKTHVSAVNDLASALDQSNGVVDESVRKWAVAKLQMAEWGDSFTASGTGLLNFADKVGLSYGDMADAMLSVPGASEKVEKAFQRQHEALSARIHAGTNFLGLQNDDALAAAKDRDALDAQHKALLDYIDLLPEGSEEQKKMKAAVEGTGDAAGGAADELDDMAKATDELHKALQIILGDLDKIAGRSPTVEQAMSDMHGAIDSLASTFKIGQAGAVMLDPKQIIGAGGMIDTHTEAGRNLRDKLLGSREAIVNAGLTAYTTEFAKSGDRAKATQAENRAVAEGLKPLTETLTLLLGSKKAAEALLVTYGLIPAKITTEIQLNSQDATNKMSAYGQLQGAVLGSGTAGPAGPPNYPGGGNGGYTGGGGAGPGGVGDSGPDPHKGDQYPAVVTRWSGLAAQALTMMGEPTSEVPSVLYRINKESTGDATIVNTTDANARKGTPSKGLVQVIDPTFKSFALPGHNTDIFDPLSNLLAGMNYSRATYGSVMTGFRRPGWYDRGGVLPAGGVAVNRLSTPEAILNPEQWRTARAAMEAGKNVSVGSVHFHVDGGIGSDGLDARSLERVREQLHRILTEETERAL